jgi:hypothetical protein
VQPVRADDVARLVLLRDLGQAPGLLLPRTAQPLLEHGPAVGGSRGEPPFDPGDGIRVVGAGPGTFGVVGVADLSGQRVAAGGRIRVDQPVRLGDGGQQTAAGKVAGRRARCVAPGVRDAGEPSGEVRREQAVRRPVHPPFGLLLEVVLGRQFVAHQRADPDDRMPYERRLTRRVDPPVVHRERVPHGGDQHVRTGRRGRGLGQHPAPGIARGQDAFGRLGEDRVPEGEQRRPVLPCDVRIGGDPQLLREPVGLAQDRGQDDVGAVPGRFPQAALGRDMPQPEGQCRIRHSGSSPTRPSRAARLAR